MLLCKCEHCDKRFQVNDELAGKRIRCPQCRQPIAVPMSPEVAPVTSPTEARPISSTRRYPPTVCAVPNPVAETPLLASTSEPMTFSEAERRRTQSNQWTFERPKHRRWLFVLVIVALIAVPFTPAFPFWLGITILALSVGAIIQTGADRMRLFLKVDTTKRLGTIGAHILPILPAFQSFSRRMLRLNSSQNWKSHIRLAMYSVLGAVLIFVGQAGAKSIKEREIVAAKNAAEESERQRLADEANATVESLVRDAEKALNAGNFSLTQSKLDTANKIPNSTDLNHVRSLYIRLANAQVAALGAEATDAINAGDLAAAKQKIQEALAVPNAHSLTDVIKLDLQITNSTDLTRIREILLELSDEAFQQLKNGGAMPAQLLSGYQALDARTGELAIAAFEEVAELRKGRRLAQLDAERKQQEESKLAADASARRAESERRNKEKARLAAAADADKVEQKPIRRGSTAYVEVEGENVVWVSVNEKAFAELNSFSSARNEDAISQMMEQGRVLVCDKRTKVSVVDPGFFSTTIRIMEGKHSGLTGIVPNEFLHQQSHRSEAAPKRSAKSDHETNTTAGETARTTKAIVGSSKLVDFVSPANGKKMLMMIVTLKNTGSTPIRVVDADITWRDSSGNVLGTHNYTIFAEFDSAPGIAPGSSWTTRKGEGFTIPYGPGIGEKAKSVKVQITKVLEHSGL